MALVAVVCDDQDGREVLARLLERAGHEVRRVDSAEAAVALLGTQPVDVAVLDLHGPDLPNAALLSHLAVGGAGPSVRTLVLGTDDGEARAAWSGGADGWLARPFPAEDLGAAVDAVVARADHDRTPHRADALATLEGA